MSILQKIFNHLTSDLITKKMLLLLLATNAIATIRIVGENIPCYLASSLVQTVKKDNFTLNFLFSTLLRVGRNQANLKHDSFCCAPL